MQQLQHFCCLHSD